MKQTETVELTTICLVHEQDKYLLQDRVKEDWRGLALPGGHVEAGESIVASVIREMKEETGLTIKNPRLCGIKQFPTENGRYIVFLFETEEFSGDLLSSKEGQMMWVEKSELPQKQTVSDLKELIEMMLNEEKSEFQYVLENSEWKMQIR